MPMLLAMGSQVAAVANAMAFSFDGGESFTQCVNPVAGNWFGAAFSPSLDYAISVSATGQVVRSFEGTTWAAMPGNNLVNGNWQAGVVRNFDDTLFVTSGLVGGGAGLRVATSPDGATWTNRPTPVTSGTAFGVRILMNTAGRIFAVGNTPAVQPLIFSDDGGLTWAYTTAPAGAESQDFQDFGLLGSTYIHMVGSTNPGPGDTFFSANGGGTWNECLRDALNDPPNGVACAVDPTAGRLFVATPANGIWGVNLGITNNPPAGAWTNDYPAGNVNGSSRAGYIEQLQKTIFCTPAGAFTTHQRIAGAWSSTIHAGALAGAPVRVKLDFLGFPPP